MVCAALSIRARSALVAGATNAKHLITYLRLWHVSFRSRGEQIETLAMLTLFFLFSLTLVGSFLILVLIIRTAWFE